jgi:polysaccharide biosynthesis transport protein
LAQQVGGLPELVDTLRRRWLLAALVAVPFVVAVVGYSASLANTYQAESVVAFTPRLPATIGGDTIRIVLPKYVAGVTAAQTVRQVAAQVGLTPHTLGGALDASIPADTTNLEIHVTLENARDAAAAATALAETALTASKSDDLLSAAVVSPATVPASPSGPHRKLIDLVGLALAVLAGVIVAFLVERGSPRIRQAEDIVKLTGYPVVGRIPRARSLRVDPVDALNDPAVGTAVRNLRLYLDAELSTQPLQTLAVTSPGVGDGKTTVAIALAAAIARLNAKVLLVDADLRRPRVALALDLPDEPSLGDVLTRNRTLAECVQTGTAGMHVVAGSVMNDVGDLLALSFSEVMAQARLDYDVVVVDCPPLLGSEDATTVTALVNGTLLVISNGSSARVVHQATLLLEALPVRVLGVVLNRARDLVSGYSATYYSRRSGSQRRIPQ